MQVDIPVAEPAENDGDNSFALLRYEIDRAKSLLESQGDSPAMRERLERLEALLAICLLPPEMSRPT